MHHSIGTPESFVEDSKRLEDLSRQVLVIQGDLIIKIEVLKLRLKTLTSYSDTIISTKLQVMQ